jgi:hypothetical protein
MSSDNYIRDGLVSQILSNSNSFDMSLNSIYNYAVGTKVLNFNEPNNTLRLGREFDSYCPQTLVIHLHHGQNSHLSDEEYINTVCNLFNTMRLVMKIDGVPILQLPLSLLQELKPAVKFDNNIYISIPFDAFFDKIDMSLLYYSNVDFTIEDRQEIANYANHFSLISKVYIYNDVERSHSINNNHNNRKFIQQMGSFHVSIPYNSSINKRLFYFSISIMFGQTKGFLIQCNVSELVSINFYVNNILRFDYDQFFIATACVKLSPNLIYMPFNDFTNFLDRGSNTYASSINFSRIESASIQLQFSSDQTKFTIHNIYSNFFRCGSGTGSLHLDGRAVFNRMDANYLPSTGYNNTLFNTGTVTTGQLRTSQLRTSQLGTSQIVLEEAYHIPNGQTIYQIINSDRNICNISHDTIEPGNRYMTCSNCSNHFLETFLKRWLSPRSGSLRTCPTCREIWTNYNIYLNGEELN